MKRLAVAVMIVAGLVLGVYASPAGATTSTEKAYVAASRDDGVAGISSKTMIRVGRSFCADVRAHGIDRAVTHSVKSVVKVTKDDTDEAAKKFGDMVATMNFDAVEYLCPEFIDERNEWTKADHGEGS